MSLDSLKETVHNLEEKIKNVAEEKDELRKMIETQSEERLEMETKMTLLQSQLDQVGLHWSLGLLGLNGQTVGGLTANCVHAFNTCIILYAGVVYHSKPPWLM